MYQVSGSRVNRVGSSHDIILYRELFLSLNTHINSQRKPPIHNGEQPWIPSSKPSTPSPFPTPHRTRTRTLQVLTLGPSRPGTGPLRSALVELGYPRVFHGYETMPAENSGYKIVIALTPKEIPAWSRRRQSYVCRGKV